MARKYVKKSKKVKFTRKLNVSEPIKAYVKKTIAKEAEYKQTQKTASPSSPTALPNNTWVQEGSIFNISPGTGDNQRTGNSVMIRTVKIGQIITFNDGIPAGVPNNALDQGCRVVIFQLKKNATTAALNILLANAGSPFGLTDDLANNENIKQLVYVLYDKLYHRNNVNMTNNLTTGVSANSHFIRHTLKLKARTAKWNTGDNGGVPTEQGDIQVYYFASQVETGTAATMPAVSYLPTQYQMNFMDV